MRISQRVIWIFSNFYIERNTSLFNKKPKFFLYQYAIFIFGLIRIMHFFLLQIGRAKKKNVISDHILIKSSAPHMHLNYFKAINKETSTSDLLYINCYDKKNFTQIIKLNFLDLCKEFRITFNEIKPVLSNLTSIDKKNNILYETLISLPIFVYFFCLFKGLKKINPNIKVYSGGAHIVSASAIEAGVETTWLCHGLIDQALSLKRENIEPDPTSYFIAYPNYDSIYLYSIDEKKYLLHHGILSKLKLYPYKHIDALKNKILIFLNDEDRNMNLEYLHELIDFFESIKYKIIIKPHPSYQGKLLKRFKGHGGIRLSDDRTPSAYKLMINEKPKFIAGWLSTTQCEAFRQGIVPICLSSESEAMYIPYQFQEKSIWWEKEQALLNELLKSDSSIYKNFIDYKAGKK